MKWMLLVSAPNRGPWYLLPILLMLVWQSLSGIPDFGYYEDVGISSEESFKAHVSERLSSLSGLVINMSHIPAFFAIAWSWCWALSPDRDAKRVAFLALVISMSFGAANELSQLVVPMRLASPIDLLLNLVGASVAVLIHGRLAMSISAGVKS